MSEVLQTNDDYLACHHYDISLADESGISRFEKEGKYYFCYSEHGSIVLRSEGYSSENNRENGIAAVLKHLSNESLYAKVKQPDGRWVLTLKAANHHEIARSCPYQTLEEILVLLPSAREKYQENIALANIEAGKVHQKNVAFTDDEDQKEQVEDDYMICREYEEQINSKHPDYADFISFKHEHTGKYYFALLNKKGEIIIRSEAYPTSSARDNGIESVIKNKDLENRWSTEEKRGLFYLILKAGNHQEIGRSCPYTSEQEVLALRMVGHEHTDQHKVEDDYMICREYEEQINSKHPAYADFISFQHEHTGKYYFALLNKKGEIIIRSEAYPTSSARDKGIESVIKNKDLENRWSTEEKRGLFYLILKAGNHQEIGRSCPFTSEQEVLALRMDGHKHSDQHKVEDDYLICREYEEQINSKHPEYNDFIIFEHEHTGKYYFAMINEQNDIVFRSEGYPSTTSRDKGLESVRQNREIKERISVEEKRGLYYLVLKAGNHQEIARSCPKISESALSILWGGSALTAAALTALTGNMSISGSSPFEKDDDYLSCDAYTGHTVHDTENNLAFFEKDHLLYFVVYHQDGSVWLRSEGFINATNRDKELQSVLQHKDKNHMYEHVEKAGYLLKILKDEHGNEIARTCPIKIAVAPLVGATLSGTTNNTSAKFNIWWLLLPLLLLVAFLLYTKTCSKETSEELSQTEIPSQPTQTAADTVTNAQNTEVDAPKEVAPDCGLNWILFDFNAYTITETASSELKEMAKILTSNPDYTGVLAAYTDEKGGDEYNKKLSLNRAIAAKNILIGLGIPEKSLQTSAEGFSNPVAKNTDDDSGRQFNRRVELRVIDASGKEICKSIAPEIPDNVKFK
ncbi:MAG: DUF1508 domain-containing protein [Saprospiraceae bacterium]|nr:DUF1508 domain-containing protein [Saprospiraceae bacterium]